MNHDEKQYRKAVALRYRADKNRAPQVTAKGRGLMAEKIIELARKSGVPVHQDVDLVQILSRLDVNDEIPPETYIIVAEILAWIYRMNQKAASQE